MACLACVKRDKGRRKPRYTQRADDAEGTTAKGACAIELQAIAEDEQTVPKTVQSADFEPNADETARKELVDDEETAKKEIAGGGDQTAKKTVVDDEEEVTARKRVVEKEVWEEQLLGTADDVTEDGEDNSQKVVIDKADTVFVARKLTYSTTDNAELLQKMHEQSRSLHDLTLILTQSHPPGGDVSAAGDVMTHLRALERRQRDIETDAERQVLNNTLELVRLQEVVLELKVKAEQKPRIISRCTVL